MNFDTPPAPGQPTSPEVEKLKQPEVLVESQDLQMLSPESDTEKGKRYLDEAWFPEYLQIQIDTPPTLVTLNGNVGLSRVAKKKLEDTYAEGAPVEPLFSYDNIDLKTYKDAARRYYTLKERIRNEALSKKPEEMSPEERRKSIAGRLYVAKINEQIATMNMMVAVKEADLETDSKKKEYKFNAAQRYLDFIYGKPQPEMFLYAVDDIRKNIATERQNTQDPDFLKACDELEAYLEQFPHNDFDPIVKPNKTRELQALVQRDLQKIYGMTLAYDKNQVLSTKQGMATLDMAVKRLNPNWTVVEDEGASGVSVDPPRERILVKPGKEFIGREMQEKVVHEVDTHARRSVNGAEADLKITSQGLDRNDDAEEGFARAKEILTYSEQVDILDLNQYICVSLARGFAPDQTRAKSKKNFKEKVWAMEPKKFSEVYDFCVKFGRFARMKNGMSKDKLEANLKQGAWTTARRVFRGFDGKTLGFAHSRDMVYPRGQMKTWFVLNESKDIVKTYELMHKFGKFDITNPRHVDAFTQLGYIVQERTLPSDEDLAFLASTHEYPLWVEA